MTDLLKAIKAIVVLENNSNDGTYLSGECPFCEDPGKSFTYSPGKNIYYCFACHKAGGTVEKFESDFLTRSPLDHYRFIESNIDLILGDLKPHLYYAKLRNNREEINKILITMEYLKKVASALKEYDVTSGSEDTP